VDDVPGGDELTSGFFAETRVCPGAECCGHGFR
jgi:hypothetical protein